MQVKAVVTFEVDVDTLRSFCLGCSTCDEDDAAFAVEEVRGCVGAEVVIPEVVIVSVEDLEV